MATSCPSSYRLDLRRLDDLGRHGLANHDHGVRAARHRALDEQQVVVGVHLQHLQVAHRDAVGAHVARHPHALDDARRERRGANRARARGGTSSRAWRGRRRSGAASRRPGSPCRGWCRSRRRARRRRRSPTLTWSPSFGASPPAFDAHFAHARASARTPAFLKWPVRRLVLLRRLARRRARAARPRSRRVSTVFTCDTTQGPALSTVAGCTVPSAANSCVMPTFLPMSPVTITYPCWS